MQSSLSRLVLVASAVAVTQAMAAAPTPGAPPAAAPTVAPAPGVVQQPAAGASVGADYVIGPGDVVQVFVWRNPELTVTIPVRPDGKISTPLVEDMTAVGKTPAALARDVEVILSEYVKSPQVNIIVTQPAGTLSQVKVTGQVQTPQALPYRQGLTVLDAVLQAGGLTDFAAGNRAKIVRIVNGKQTEIEVRLNRLLEKGDMSQNHPLRPGDVLLIPQSRF